MNITMDDFAFDRLPDRQKLTGAPLPNQDYRDGADPDVVYRWVEDGHTLHGHGQWQVMTRLRPAP